MTRRPTPLASLGLFLAVATARGATCQSDAVVFGATSGGVVAAAQTARLGRTVQLVEASPHVAGMTSGGLGWIDFGRKESIGVTSHEFFAAVAHAYRVVMDGSGSR